MITGTVELDRLSELLETTQEDAYRFFRGKINTDWKHILIEMNLANLNVGIRPDGSVIEKTPVGNQKMTRYERYTVYLKQKRGLPVDFDSPVNLKDTGEFRAAIDIQVGLNEIYFINKDWKSEILESIWGQVIGITEEQLFQFTDIILPEIEAWAIRRFRRQS